jgi:hypothetical protein
MRTIAAPLVIALLLAIAGGVCWTLGHAEAVLGQQEEQLLTLQYVAAQGADTERDIRLRHADAVPALGPSLSHEGHAQALVGNYWLGQYDPILSDRDPAFALAAANATFRKAQTEAADRQATLHSLQDALRRYAEVMKADPTLEDAAYNYELTSRVRAGFERSAKNATPLVPLDPTATLHGRLGGPPKGVAMSNFKVIVPKRPDERQENQDAGKGGQKSRKG